MIKHTLAFAAAVCALVATGHVDLFLAPEAIHGALSPIPGNVCTSFQGIDDGEIGSLCSNALDDCRPLDETGVELFCVSGDRTRI